MINISVETFGLWTAFLIWGWFAALGLWVLLKDQVRRALQLARHSPFRALLTIAAVGILTAYAQKPTPKTVEIAQPVAEVSLVYSGNMLNGFKTIDSRLIVSGTTNETAVGTYKATFKLPSATATETYQWTGGGTGDIEVTWTIAARPVTEASVIFDGAGGTPSEASRQVTDGAPIGTLPTATRTGYTFVGWFTAATGGEEVTKDFVVTADMTVYAHWTIICDPTPVDPTPVDPTPVDPTPVDPTPVDPTPVDPTPVDPTPIIPENVIAVEEVAQLFPNDAPLSAELAKASQTYNAFVMDGKELVGTLQLTTSKADKKGVIKVKATLIENGVKTQLTGVLEADGMVTLTDKRGVISMKVSVGENGLTAADGDVVLSGSRNMLADKGAASELAKWKGVWSVIMTVGSAGYIQLSVNVGNKGVTKISGMLPDGTKIGASTTVITDDEDRAFVAVDVPLYSKKGGFSALFVLNADGSVKVVGEPKWDMTGAKAKFDGEVTLTDGAKAADSKLEAGTYEVSVDAAAFGEGTVTEALPNGLIITVKGGKISCPKAGKVTLVKQTGAIVTTGENPSGLKLTYTAKTGAVKGSYDVYRVEKGKLKKYAMTVTGTVVGDRLYAVATNKNLGLTVLLFDYLIAG